MALVMAGGLSASIVASLAFSISSPLRSRVNWKSDLCVPKTLSELMTWQSEAPSVGWWHHRWKPEACRAPPDLRTSDGPNRRSGLARRNAHDDGAAAGCVCAPPGAAGFRPPASSRATSLATRAHHGARPASRRPTSDQSPRSTSGPARLFNELSFLDWWSAGQGWIIALDVECVNLQRNRVRNKYGVRHRDVRPWV